jgi:hypothetical protein
LLVRQHQRSSEEARPYDRQTYDRSSYLLRECAVRSRQTKSLDPLDEHMRVVAGPRALNCGNSNVVEPVTKDSPASKNSCAFKMSDQGKPFFIRFDGWRWEPTDPVTGVGLALNDKGTMYLMIYREVAWTKAELAHCRRGAKLAAEGKVIVETCPQPNKLFVTGMQSLTCFPPAADNQPTW